MSDDVDAKAPSDSAKTDDQPTNDAELGEKGKKALEAEREARRAADAKAKDLADRLKAFEDKETERAAAEAKRAEEEATAKGEFERLANERKSQLDKARDDLAAARSEADQLKAAMAEVLESEWKALPAEVRDLWPGADDDLLGRFGWLPKAKKHADALNAKQEAKPGNNRDPKPGGPEKASPDQERAGYLRAFGNYRM
jgi:hypothetical protein